jgi:hypothetical protein
MDRNKKTLRKELQDLITARNLQEEKIKKIKKSFGYKYTFLYLIIGFAVGAAAAENLIKFAFSAVGSIPDFYPKTVLYGRGLIFMAIGYFFTRGLAAIHDNKMNASVREMEKVRQSLSDSINKYSNKLNELEESENDI